MDVVVLTICRSDERQRSISGQFQRAGIRFEFFFGVDGRDGEHPLFGHYDHAQRLRIKGEPLSNGQLGCFASHYLLWQRCVERGRPMLILEDDALIVPPLFRELIARAEDLSQRYDCVRLFQNRSRLPQGLPVARQGSFTVSKFWKGHMGTTGYLLTPQGASRLLAHAGRWVLPVDIYMDQFWRNGVECYGLEPACVTNDPRFDSSIGYTPRFQKPVRGWRTRARRELYGLLNSLGRARHNMMFRLRMITTAREDKY